ncbi:GNAT family N-acetyltransferase [Sphaerisporangium sp. NPDC051011]|uniref:GNAT family N-acetyltransferase n=1 Tax=Sphaerisporangium sp. NPDC051011 TaxID=3155792 RepID=UPI0033D95C89
METLNRRTATDQAGRPVLSYVEGTRAGRPCADLAEELAPGAVEVILRDMPGWVVSGNEDLGRRLLAAGARPLRHAHVHSRDLRAAPAPAEWAETGYGVVSSDAVPAAEVFPAWHAAYGPGHPDHRPVDDTELLERELEPLLDGRSHGPLLPCGGLLLRDGRVVAGVLVGDRGDPPPVGGPWIYDVFRDPSPQYAGLGAVMLRRALSLATLHGLPALGLAVTEGNPARRLYERLGFRHLFSSVTVIVPD